MINGPLKEQGIYLDMANDEYRSYFGVSQSELKTVLDESPAHLKAKQESPEERTDALIIGEIFHGLVLNQNPKFHIRPRGMKFTTKEGKQWKEEHADAPIITEFEMSEIDKMIANVRNHPICGQILRKFTPEVSFFYNDKFSGEMVKGRIDIVPDQGNTLCDIKTAISAKPELFAKQAASLRYNVQAAFYLDYWEALRREGWNQRTQFLFIAVEKTAPYPVVVYQVDAEAIEIGRAEYQKALAIYSDCRRNDKWPSYSMDIQTLSLPQWKRRQAIQEFEGVIS